MQLRVQNATEQSLTKDPPGENKFLDLMLQSNYAVMRLDQESNLDDWYDLGSQKLVPVINTHQDISVKKISVIAVPIVYKTS